MFNLGALPISAIGPAFYGQGGVNNATPPQLFCGPDDNSCVYFAVGNGNSDPGVWGKITKGFNVFVVDVSGNFTFYSTGNVESGTTQFSSILPFGAGLFLVTTLAGNTYWVTAANQQTNNHIPILIKKSAYPLSNPCYNSVQNVFYDASKKILIAGFYQPAGQNGTNIFSSAYSVSPGLLTLYSQGFVANVQSGQPDPFNQTAPAGSGLNASQLQSNGLTMGLKNFNSGGNPFYLTRQITSVNPGGNTSCGGPGNGATVTTSTNDALAIFVATGGNNYSIGDCSIPRLVGVRQSFGTTFYIAGDGVSFSFTLNPIPNNVNNFAFTNSHFFFLARDGSNNPGQIYVLSRPSLVVNGAAANKRGLGLINGVRPISVSGKYKA